MSSSLLNIGKSGTIAARTALDLTAQNIANANNEDYSRRSVSMAEVASTANVAYYGSTALSGVRVDQVKRSDSIFLQNQARRTNGDVGRAEEELSGLRNAEAAIEQAGIYPALVEFEATLGQLSADPLNEALRAAVLESGRTIAETLRIADHSLNMAGDQIRFEAAAGADQVNVYAAELARINGAIVRTEPGTNSHAALLDQRDAQLRGLSGLTGIAVNYEPSGLVNVQLGDGSGAVLVSGTASSSFAMDTNSDGTIAFTLDGSAASTVSGSLTGAAQALAAQRDLGAELDALAAQIITIANAAQTSGAALDGSGGQPFFGGSTASDIAVVLDDGAQIATAPAGSPPGSRNTANLEALRDTLASNGPAAEADRILFELSNAVASRQVTRDALATIAETATISLSRESAVDLDAEAANLVRFQQAFQASGRVIQVANDIFDTILGIR